jgi:type I restriction enzyme R subunit
MSLNESHIEDAALKWFGELGYAVGHGPELAPGEYAEGALTPALCLRPSPLRSGSQGEREKREAIRRLTPAISEEARATDKESLSIQPNMGLMAWRTGVVRKGDVTVAKNYL